MKATIVLCQSINCRLARRPLNSQRGPARRVIAASLRSATSSSLSPCRLTHSRRQTIGC